MNVYVTKEFARFARKAGLLDAKLLQAAGDVAKGQYDADLGGGEFKRRVARGGAGESGGLRTILLLNVGGYSVFAYAFAKNSKANVSVNEPEALEQVANVLIGFSDEQLQAAKAAGELSEVSDGDDNKQEG